MNPLAQKDLQYVWHPFTQMQEWSQQEQIVTSGKGALLISTASRIWMPMLRYGPICTGTRILASIDRFVGSWHASAILLPWVWPTNRPRFWPNS